MWLPRRFPIPLALKAVAGLAAIGAMAAITSFDTKSAAYRLASVERQSVVASLTASGRIRPTLAVELHAPRDGQIESVLVDVNHHASKGEVLARLVSGIEQAQLDAARSAYRMARANRDMQELAVEKARGALSHALAERGVPAARAEDLLASLSFAAKDLQRKEKLFTSGAISAHDLDKAKSDYEAISAQIKGTKASAKMIVSKIVEAEANLRIAEARVKEADAKLAEMRANMTEAEYKLAQSAVSAPMDGLVIGRMVEPGQSVSSGQDGPPLFQMVQDLHRMEVHTQVDETDIGRVAVGQRVQFTVDSYPNRAFSGRVLEIHRAPVLVQNVVTYNVVASATNDDLALFPGMTAVVEIFVEETEPTFVVPNAALRFRPTPEASDALAASPEDMEVNGSDGSGGLLWVLGPGGEPRPVEVETGASNDSVTEVASDQLQVGQEVIVGHEG